MAQVCIQESRWPQPFVKWAGGKAQLVHRLSALAPSNFDRYVEPFVGGGALFFHLRPQTALISDTNNELINTYKVMKRSLRPLMEELSRLNRLKLTRALYNRFRTVDPDSLRAVERAARFIFLNKTCYNGLYRVNNNGVFNVPFGKYESMPTLYNEENLKHVSRLLQSTEIMIAGFDTSLDKARASDFIYLDPPYAWDADAPTFTSFTKERFDESDQRRLAHRFRQLDKAGCQLMLSNSDTRLTRELYFGFKFIPVTVDRMINCIGSKRTGYRELVILNYEPQFTTLHRWLTH
jgi:DNA adenine methylase